MFATRLIPRGGLGLLAAALGFALVTRASDLAERDRHRQQLERWRGDAVGTFEPEMVAGVPEPARRYFEHAIAPGTPIASHAELEMGGKLRLSPDGAWMPLRARQILAPPDGFVWEATVGRGPMSFGGADSYVHGVAEMNFRLWGLVPFVRAGGPDVARSARGRLAGEAIWNPAALLPQNGVTWEAIDDRSARATMVIDGEALTVTIDVDEAGRLVSARLPRWGDRTNDGPYASIPFGVNVLDEATFDGYTIPTRIAGGWWFGTDRYFEFARFEVERARFR